MAGNEYVEEGYVEDGYFLDPVDGATEVGQALTVDSSAWTGLTRTIVDARNAVAISKMITKALDALPDGGSGNVEVMQAAAYLKAAQELVNAPEPPSALIWQLISRAADVVGLIGLFYTIFSQASQ